MGMNAKWFEVSTTGASVVTKGTTVNDEEIDTPAAVVIRNLDDDVAVVQGEIEELLAMFRNVVKHLEETQKHPA